MGVPVVDDDGEIQFPGKLELAAEDRLLLLFAGVILPMVVETDLADGADLGVLRQLSQGLVVFLRGAAALLRVDAVSRRRPTPFAWISAKSWARSGS